MLAPTSAPFSTQFTRVLFGMLCIAFVMQIFVVFRLEINFDEFYTYNRSFEMARGDVDNPLQTLLLRIVSWAHYVPGNDIDQIIATRVMMFFFGLITCVCIFKTARRYTSVAASLYAVFCYIGFYPVFLNLTALRVDGTVTMLLMVATYVASDPVQSRSKSVAIGCLLGLAGMITMKSIFYAPIITGFLMGQWARSGWSTKALTNGLIAFASAWLSFLILYIWHSGSMKAADTGTDYVSAMASKSLFSGGFLPNPSVIFHGIFISPIWIFILLGLAGSIWALIKRKNASGAVEKALLIFPIATVFFYTHAYPYYYVFIMAPGVVLAALAFDRYFTKDRALVFATVIGMQFMLMTTVFLKANEKNQDYQREILSVVHSVFPTPVSYIDYCGMIPSHDRIVEGGIFISPDSFQMRDYFKNDPIMDGILRRHQPKYFLANASSLDLAGDFTHPFNIDLQDEDVETLTDNFIKFWGPLYLPGKRLKETDEHGVQKIDILIEGTYTLKSSHAIKLNAQTVAPGQAVVLSAGTHEIAGRVHNNSMFMWGDNLEAPEERNRPNYIFFGF